MIETMDQKIREEMGEYYIVSKTRLQNLLDCFDGGAKRIVELTEIINKQQVEIGRLSRQLIDIAKE